MSKLDKSNLRKQILSARKALSTEVWDKRNQLLHRQAIEFIFQQQARTIHSFLPIEKNKEVNTWLIVKDLLEENYQVVISIIDFKKETMGHYYYRPGIKFKLNQMKIPEPLNAEKADVSTVEMVLIPLIAADKKGNRIGYGKGYYDRLLASLSDNVIKIGLSLGSLFDEFPFNEAHDIKLNYCITPFELIKCDE